MSCPACSCTDWKLASLVYREGLQRVKATTTGQAVGAGTTGIGGGFGSSRTNGIAQSELSRLAAPPAGMALTTLCTLGVIVTGGFAFIFGKGWLLATVPLALATVIAFQAESRAHGAALQEWSKVRMCTRCGHFYYVPTQDPLHLNGGGSVAQADVLPPMTPFPELLTTLSSSEFGAVMKRYGITFDGKRYHFKQLQYENLEDAVRDAESKSTRNTGG